MDPQPAGSLLVTVTVQVRELPAGPVLLAGAAATVGAWLHVTTTYATALPLVVTPALVAVGVTFLLPLAPTGEVTVMVVVLEAPPATVTVPGGVNEALQPAEPPWKFAPMVQVRDPHAGASGFVIVTVYASAEPASPLCVRGTAATVGAWLHGWMT